MTAPSQIQRQGLKKIPASHFAIKLRAIFISKKGIIEGPLKTSLKPYSSSLMILGFLKSGGGLMSIWVSAITPLLTIGRP